MTPEQQKRALALLMEWVFVWSGNDGDSTGWHVCRLCDSADWRGHAETCELSAILRSLGVEPVITPVRHPVRGGIKIEMPPGKAA